MSLKYTCYLIIIFNLLITSLETAIADQNQVFRFGVLAFRPKNITQQQWQPLANKLQDVLGKKVELLPIGLSELDNIEEQKLDFFLVNPEQYILLKKKISINAIATLINMEQGHPINYFAGAIFVRSDRDDIHTLKDLNNKVIASPGKNSLGGYLMQLWELEKLGVKAKSYLFLGMPQDNTVYAVLERKADAGFVRTGILENLAREGKISLHDIRVLQGYIANQENIPLLHSTEYYPEWAFAISKTVHPEVARKVSITLLNIRSDDAVAKAAGIAGFDVPADYASVEILMLRLRYHPEELKYFDVFDILLRYKEFFIIFGAIAFLFLLLVIFLIIANFRFKKIANENKKLLLAVEQSPVSIIITDLNGNIEYVNHQFLETTGYQLTEVLGKNTRLLKSEKVDHTIYQEMWSALKKGYEWYGELINRRKNGSEYISSVLITPVRQTDGKITHYLAVKQDITDRKQTEEQIKKLAFYDSLTGLANRRKLLDHLDYLIKICQREQHIFAVLMMDLDKFKPVNDKFGHAAGDELLQQVATRILQHLRSSDLVARLGGDEFVIVLYSLQKLEDAAQVALKVIHDLTEPFALSQNRTVRIGVSIGMSFYPIHGDTPDQLINKADTALYEAKGTGGDRYSS